MRAIGYGALNAREYVTEKSFEMCRFVQIEHIDAIDSLEEIVKIPYIDGFIFGPNDLSGSINDFLNVYDEKTTKLMEYAIKKLKENNKYIGIATGSSDKEVVEHWSKMGADMICAGDAAGYLT